MSRAPDVATLNAELEVACAEVERLTAAAESADAAYVLNYGDDMAMVSGTRKKYSARATARKFGAGDRTAAAWALVRDAEEKVKLLETRIERVVRDTPVPFTPADLKAARFVRTRHGWHEVVRVSAKSVTVRTEWSWNDRAPIEDVIEVRR